jgi:hypothetical protein
MDKTLIIAKLKELYNKRNERLVLNAKAAILEQEEKNLHAELVAAKVAQGVYGKFVLVAKSKEVPKCDDWTAFHQYIIENNAPELLHKRVTESAVMERIDAGEIIPGISTDTKVAYTVKEM